MFQKMISSAVLLSLTLPVAVLAAEKVPLDKLPEVVVKAVKERFPKAELLSAEREEEDGQVYYEIDIRHEGKRYEVEVTPEGKIIEVDEDDDRPKGGHGQ